VGYVEMSLADGREGVGVSCVHLALLKTGDICAANLVLYFLY